ncbi:MAG: hypothetical protein K2L21_06945 [Muribaculaceae bacterium]|nr:hypothetical protein [Muribaculaceae bacterium]
MTLSDEFHELLKADDNEAAARLVLDAPESAEREGLLSLMLHEGIGVEPDLDGCFDHAQKAADGHDPLGYFMLGYLCDNAETPDQAEGGPRQQYDQYDAERFYELCSKLESRWKDPAVLWLAEHYMDMAAGGDPEIGVEYYESIADHNADAAACLSDYYWNLIMPLYLKDDEWEAQLLKWTTVAADMLPEEYCHRMGWMYADGIGCEKSWEKAFDYFNQAYEAGDWRGAAAIAKIYEEYLEENPDLDAAEVDEIKAEIERCKQLADEMCAEEAASEPDPSIDDD